MALEDNFTDKESIEIQFQNGFNKRSNTDLFKIFILEHRKSIRGYIRISLVSITLLPVWLITKSWIVLIIMIPFIALVIVGIIGYLDSWRLQRKFEKDEIPRRAFIKERTLRYGDYGLVIKELSNNGLSQEKYAWIRYGVLIEWENFLILLPAKKKAHLFIIRADEIGMSNFSKFREFAKSKLKYKLITSYKDII